MCALGVVDYSDKGTIWLIDYRLKPRENTSAHKRESTDDKKVFYGSDAGRYIEIYSEYVEGRGDRLSWLETEGVEGDCSSVSPGSCHSFDEQVEAKGMAQNEGTDGTGDTQRWVQN